MLHGSLLSWPAEINLPSCVRICLSSRGQTTPYQPAISPEPVGHLAQHHLLPLLVEAVRQQPNIELRMGHRCGGRWALCRS